MVLITLLFFPLFFLPQLIIAQPKDLRFEKLISEENLPSATVLCTVQDSRGFIWIGTEGGLCRFDGYNLKIFKGSPDKKGSLSINLINCLFEDSKGILWVGTDGGGLNKFIPSDESFISYMHNPDPYSISDNLIASIIEDKDGILWVGTKNGGLNGFDRESGRFKTYKNIPWDTNSLSSNAVSSICEDRAGNLWVGTDGGGLNKFDKKNNKFTRYRHNKQNQNSISSDEIVCIYEDRKGNLWTGTTIGLNKFVFGNVNGMSMESDKKIYKAYHYFINPPKIMISICEDENNLLWIISNEGLVIFETESENYSIYKDFIGIISPVRNSIYRDKNGIIWISALEEGLYYYDKYKRSFKHYLNLMVHSICDDKYDNLYVGTDEGLYVFDSKRENAKKILYNKAHPKGVAYNFVNFLNSTIPDILLVGMDPYMYKYDINTGAISSYKNIPGLFDISTVFIDQEGLLWAGTREEGIKVFNKEMTEIAGFKHNNDDPSSLSGGMIAAIYQDKGGVIWVGTKTGLNKLNSRQSKPGNKDTLYFEITHYKSNKEDSTSLSSNLITALYEDEKGFLWVGTYGGGLNKLDKSLDKFTHYTEDDGLVDNSMIHILPDNSGNLWLSTLSGLSKFNPEAGTFKNYDKGDGLQSNEFNWGPYYKSKKGELFFGGTNGLNAFFPDSIKDNPHIPPVVITSFKVFNKEAELEKSILETDEITLSYKDNFISFEFSALDYTNPSKNQYKYQLEGVDKDWVKTTASKREASYTDVDPGEYVFRVKGSNNDGGWNEEGTSVRIIITPPFWRTWWFTTCSVLLIAGMFGGTVRYVSVQRLKRRLDLERERLRISNDMHDEVGSSLTRITLLSEVAKKKLGNIVEINRISDASREVVNNMDEIVWAVNPKNDTLDNLAAYVLQYAQEFFGVTNISCRFDYPQTIPEQVLSSDIRHNIFLVIKEAHNNIVKHSEASEVSIGLTVNQSSFEFAIIDNGKGFAKESSDQFANGLNNMQKRINDIKGKFVLETSPGTGTKIKIIIPI